MSRRLFRVVGVVTVITLLSRFFGFLREAIIGYQFGTSHKADQIILSYTIPNFIYLVVGGALTTAFVSVYSKIQSDRHRKSLNAWLMLYVSLLITFFVLVCILFSEQCVRFFFPGLPEEQVQQTAELFAYTAPSTVFLVLSTWMTGILNVHGKFYYAAFATLLNNMIYVVLSLALYRMFGLFSYAFGAVVSAMVMCAFLIYAIKDDVSFRLYNYQEVKPLLKNIFQIFFPVALGGATLQLYTFIQRIFASQLETGYVAALNYATKLIQLPQIVLMTSVTTVIYPMLAKKVAENDEYGIVHIFVRGFQQLLLFFIPASLFIFVYAKEIVIVIFGYGAFTESSVYATTEMLQIFVISMFGQVANMFITRFFYAKEKTIYPVISGLVSLFIFNVLFVSFFLPYGGAKVIAWGTVASVYAHLLILLIGVMKMFNFQKRESFFFKEIALGSLVMFLLFRFVEKFVSDDHPFVQLVFGSLILFVFLFLAYKMTNRYAKKGGDFL